MGIQVQPTMNYQPSFGMAKQVIVEDTVDALGKKAASVVFEAVPGLYSVGDDNTVVTVARDYILKTFRSPDSKIPQIIKEYTDKLKITTSVYEDEFQKLKNATWLDKMIKKLFPIKTEQAEVLYGENSLSIPVPTYPSSIVSAAKQNIDHINYAKEAEIMSIDLF